MTVSQMATNNPQIQDEPLYVNAKQYHRILKRREARARQQATSRLQRKEKGKQVFHIMNGIKFKRHICMNQDINMP